METIFQTIGRALVIVAIAIAGIFGFGGQAPVNDNVGATVPVTVATFQTSLQTSITSSATSMTLVTGTDKAGNNISGYICFNIDEGTSLEEFVCGTASGTSVTSMIRGIDPIDGDLEVAALKKAHRRGASVKVTNYPSLAIISRILNGAETIPNAITYANGIGPVNAGDLADKEYVLAQVSGGAVTFEKVVISGNAGETVAAGNLLYLDSADSEWKKTDADTASSVENVMLGIAQGAGTDGASIAGGVLIRGIDSNQTGLSANTIYYASNTAGGLSSSAGTKEVTIGVATGTTSIIFFPRYNQMLTEDQQDALAGTGTPSASNKFVTADGIVDASTTVAGDVEEATQGEIDAGTAAGTVARLFLNPATVSKFLMGVGPTTVAKSYFNIQLPFILWTGSANDNLVTDYENWTISSTEVVTTPGGAMAKMTGTGAESLYTTAPLAISGSADLDWTSTNIVIMDWWAKLPATSTGDIFMGFAADNGYFDSTYAETSSSRTGFAMRGSTGVIYAVTNNGAGITTTDISSGITNTNWNNFRVELDLSNQALLYINGTLKATLSGANLENTGALSMGFGRSDTAVYAITAPNFSLEMNP